MCLSIVLNMHYRSCFTVSRLLLSTSYILPYLRPISVLTVSVFVLAHTTLSLSYYVFVLYFVLDSINIVTLHSWMGVGELVGMSPPTSNTNINIWGTLLFRIPAKIKDGKLEPCLHKTTPKV